MSEKSLEESLKHVEHDLEKVVTKEEADKWLSYVSLSTAIIAILAAIVGLYESQMTASTVLAKNEAVLLQSKASDQWSFFQAKSMKGHIYEVNAQLFPQKADEFQKKVEKYKKEQAEITQKARSIEAAEEIKNKESEAFAEKHHISSFAITFLQISIAIASISALTKNKTFWLSSIGLAAIGAGIAAYAVSL